jgi:RNA polymerase sigma-70 factor (ECF subfamily)
MEGQETTRETDRGGAGQFAETHWSMVLAAGDSASPGSVEAMEKLCRTYWYPLYAFVRRRGCAEHDAKDLTQGFFAHLLERHAFRSVVQNRGKFRSFLLKSLKNYLTDEHERQCALKRGGGEMLISIDAQEAEHRYQHEPAASETPEKLFEQRWAFALLDAALSRLDQEYAASGKGPLFTQLRGFLVHGAHSKTHAQIAAQIGMSEEAVKKASQRLRQRYQQIIREEIGRTVATASEIEEEMRYLWSVLGA